MTDETIVQPDEGGESLPVVSVPKSDAEAAELEAAATPEVQDSEKPKPDPVAQDKEERQRNRTTQYIERLKAEVAALRANAPQPVQQAAKAPESEGKPTLKDYDYDLEAHGNAVAEWAAKEAVARLEKAQETRAKEAERHDAVSRYEEQVQAVLDVHPDFYEVVGTIDPQFITPELEAAIIKHPNGARLAYHIGTNDDDAFLLASTRPELMAAAVDRLAKRLAAPAAPVAAPAPPKPITQAPAPPPSLAGKSSVSAPAEKLTDEQWLARERERTRKR